MRRLLLLSAVAGIAATTLAATSPAEAAFHLIRWEGSGFCQIWDESIPTVPYPSNYAVVSESLPTFWDALAVKNNMLSSGSCSL